ncbi:hypothetical protein HPB48_008290 [Haemaphysalis longicornis]|uniref:Tc1-like transposase DDE domain-containing protein n=1 Tax=Haemaphysalis longicornis TaxID=44386 RepID=A0A9J6GSI6_HAELO|nr:hypothetical protein HPB48_008290 [Haemaphysalis longicornis]
MRGGLITRDCLGPFIRLPRLFNSPACYHVIDNKLIPHVLNGHFKEGCYILQQDPSFFRAFKAVQRLLEERGVRLFECPPNEADLRAIENIWGEIKYNVAHLYPTTATANYFWLVVNAEWEALLQKPGQAEGTPDCPAGSMTPSRWKAPSFCYRTCE